MHSNTIFPLESKYFAFGTTWFVEDDLLDEIDFSFAVLFLHKSFILDGFTRNMQDEKTTERYTLNYNSGRTGVSPKWFQTTNRA